MLAKQPAIAGEKVKRRRLSDRQLYAVAAEDAHGSGNEAGGAVSSTSSGGRRRRRLQVLAMLHRLQEVCNHPWTINFSQMPTSWRCTRDSGCGDEPENSGKMARCVEIIDEILEFPREKVLVFTQYLRTLDLLVETITRGHPDIEVLALKGSMRSEERDEAVARFQEDPACCVFVCTLGSGGVGLNMTAAAHVIHFDRCWNPAREAQATDRAHRLGQRSTVMVHRLTCEGTFEERLNEEMQRKAALAREVVPVESGSGIAASIVEYSADELRDLFKLW